MVGCIGGVAREMSEKLWSDERIDWTVLGAHWSGDKRTDAVRAKLLMQQMRDEYERHIGVKDESIRRLQKQCSRLFVDGHEALEATEKELRRLQRLHPDRDTQFAIAKCVATASFMPANVFLPEAERVREAVHKAQEWLNIMAREARE